MRVEMQVFRSVAWRWNWRRIAWSGVPCTEWFVSAGPVFVIFRVWRAA